MLIKIKTIVIVALIVISQSNLCAQYSDTGLVILEIAKPANNSELITIDGQTTGIHKEGQSMSLQSDLSNLPADTYIIKTIRDGHIIATQTIHKN